jgi:hypothetical protein
MQAIEFAIAIVALGLYAWVLFRPQSGISAKKINEVMQELQDYIDAHKG